MKNWRKPIAVMLAAGMAVCSLAGCNKTEEDINLSDEVLTSTTTVVTGGEVNSNVTGNKGGSKTTTTTTTSDGDWGGALIKGGNKIDDKEVLSYDMKGAQIILYGYTKPDASKSKAEAAQLEALNSVAKKLNCKIKYVESTTDKTKSQTTLNVMSNTHFADIITTEQHGVVGYLTSDLLSDMSKIETMDLSKSYMNVGDGVNAFHLGSGYWAVNEPMSLSTAGSYIFFNKRIMKEVTGDENYPYKLMSQKKWNISNWRELNKKGTKELDGDGKMTKSDQWGLIQLDIGTAGFSSILQANRAYMIKNENGVLSYNMEDGKCIPAINLGVEVYYKDNTCINAGDSDAVKLFTSGHGLFFGGAMAATCASLSDMKDDFGILPYPCGDGQTEYSVCTNWNCTALAIPACVPKKDNKLKNAGAFLQAYMLVMEDVVDAKFDEYKLRYCRDDESKENLLIGYRAQVTTASAATANDEAIKMGTYRVCYDASGTSPATTVAANKGISIKAIADLNAKLK